jgi:hypothetical protein
MSRLGLCLDYLKKKVIHLRGVSTNKSIIYIPEKDISRFKRGGPVQVVFYNNCCRGLCLNYLKKISQTWRSSVGSELP